MHAKRTQLKLTREYLEAVEKLRLAQKEVQEKKKFLVENWEKDWLPNVIGSPYAGNVSFQIVEGSYVLDRELVKFFLMNSLYPHIDIQYPLDPGSDRTICTHLTQAGYMKQNAAEVKVWTTPPSKFRK